MCEFLLDREVGKEQQRPNAKVQFIYECMDEALALYNSNVRNGYCAWRAPRAGSQERQRTKVIEQKHSYQISRETAVRIHRLQGPEVV